MSAYFELARDAVRMQRVLDPRAETVWRSSDRRCGVNVEEVDLLGWQREQLADCGSREVATSPVPAVRPTQARRLLNVLLSGTHASHLLSPMILL